MKMVRLLVLLALLVISVVLLVLRMEKKEPQPFYLTPLVFVRCLGAQYVTPNGSRPVEQEESVSPEVDMFSDVKIPRGFGEATYKLESGTPIYLTCSVPLDQDRFLVYKPVVRFMLVSGCLPATGSNSGILLNVDSADNPLLTACVLAGDEGFWYIAFELDDILETEGKILDRFRHVANEADLVSANKLMSQEDIGGELVLPAGVFQGVNDQVSIDVIMGVRLYSPAMMKALRTRVGIADPSLP